MTLEKFQRLLSRANSKLKVRMRGDWYGDCGGLFTGIFGRSGYIARMSKGELQMHGYRFQVVDPRNPMRLVNGHIQKRGRRTLVEILKNYRWLSYIQAARVRWGLDPMTGLAFT